MSQVAKAPKLALSSEKREDKCGAHAPVDGTPETTDALVEDFVAERAITALDTLLSLAKCTNKGNCTEAAELAGDLHRDSRLLHDEVRRFLDTTAK